MNITLFTLGTRGDVQPFAILGEALAKKGHHVTLSTAKNFRELVESHHIHFHPVDINSEDLLNSKEGRQIIQVDLFSIQRNLNKFIYPLIESSLNEFYQLGQNSDLVIYRSKTLADVFVDQLDCMAIRAAVVPAMEETAEFINPVMSGFKIPVFMNKWSYKLNDLRYSFFKKPLDQFRSRNSLPDLTANHSKIPSIYGISPHFLNRPKDWSENHYLTGFWFSEKKSELDGDLQEFIDRGKTPLLITFSSMPIEKEFKELIIKCIDQLDERFIIAGEWNEFENNTKLKIISSAPFGALIPKMKAVIHHGGIGTTAECLRAGKPMFVCPAVYPFGDQYFWGNLVYQKGLGVKPAPLSKLSSKLFIKRINQLLHHKLLYINSALMAKKINSENGVQKAVQLIEKIMARHPSFVR